MSKGYALCIGLNVVDPAHYQGWNGKLNAPEKDAADMQALAIGAGFETRILKGKDATRERVLREIKVAYEYLESGDIFILFYSGHGGQLPDLDGDEDDGLDETVCLYNGQMLDDEISLQWQNFKKDVRIFMLSDSCHSGTIAKPVEERVIEYSPYTKKSMPLDIISSVYLQNKAEYDIYIDEVNLKKKDFKEISASVILISGCQDNQSSYDGVFNSKFTERLLQVWNGGKFTDNHAKFHAQISLGMPSYQSPNFFYAGKRNIAFENQIPFTINDQKGGPTFLIDLSSVALGEDLTKSIDDAIQKAVSGELAKASAKGKITLIPISGPKGGPGGGITMGYRL